MATAKIVDLYGKPCEGPIAAITPLSVLKDLVRKIESGEVVLEQVLVIGCVAGPEGTVTHPLWDNDLRIETVMHLLETVKFDILTASKVALTPR
jgi:hypothetical protein